MALNETEKISIVIPAYNCEGSIERCLDSALMQTYGNTEIVVVNDGSTDRTAEILSEYEKKDQRVHVIHKANGGVAAARNDGMKAATGIWLVTLDADDYIDREMLSCMHDAVARSEADLAVCGFRYVYEHTGRKETRQPAEDFVGNRQEVINTIFLSLYDKLLLNNQNNKLYRLSIIREHEIYYDPAMQINEDLWFSLSYMRYCEEIAVLRRAFLNYTQHAEGESLVSKFHDNCVETCFAVLEAYDALFDSVTASDTVINAMNNRMFLNICGYAGWQYYKSGYSEAKMLENIRALCNNEAFQRLLSQTDPIGMKNRVAFYLLKKKRAEAYHNLCRLLYRGKAGRAEAPEAKETQDMPVTPENSCTQEAQAAPEAPVAAAEESVPVPETEAKPEAPETEAVSEAETEEKKAFEAEAEENAPETELISEAGTIECENETADASKTGNKPETAEEADEEQETEEAFETEPGKSAESAERERSDRRAGGRAARKAKPVVVKRLRVPSGAPVIEIPDLFPEEEDAVQECLPGLRPDRREDAEETAAKQRARSRQPKKKPEMIEGQIELFDLMEFSGSTDGISESEMEEISKKLESSIFK